MIKHGKVLVAIDDSAASWKALDEVANLVRTQPELAIQLFHAACYPPDLQEFRGAEGTKEEEKLDNQLKRKQEHWERRVKSDAAPLFKKARAILEGAGAAPERLHAQASALMHREDLIDEIVKAAHESGCNTIVVGRNSFPWLKELLVGHLGDEISRQASGISVRVID
jgi:nucleotide-binding universal stress UspA family protein